MVKLIFVILTMITLSFADDHDNESLLQNNSLYLKISKNGFVGENNRLEQIITNATLKKSLTESEMSSQSKQQLIFVELLTSYYIKHKNLPKPIQNRLCQHSDTSFKCIQIDRVYDGDTIFVNIKNVHPIIGKSVSVRINGIYIPEMRTKNDCEKRMANIAKSFVTTELRNAQTITLKDVQIGKYFRLLANVIYDGKNLSQELINNYLAYPYYGKTE